MKKIATLMLILFLGLGALAVPAMAKENPAPQTVEDAEDFFWTEEFRRLTPEEVAKVPSIELTADQEGISTYADVIETYYARNKNDGKLYKRRWNATRGYWVDRDWILVG